MTPKKFNHCLERIRNGDTTGIEDIFNKYYQNMILTAMVKLNNFTDAEDIASNFIEYILKNAPIIGYIENPSAWIFQSIRNNAVSFIKKESKKVYLNEFAEDFLSVFILYKKSSIGF